MSTLKDLVNRATDLESQLVEMAGELTPEMEASLLELEIALPEKVDRYAGFMDRVVIEAAFLGEKAERYARAATVLTNLAKKLDNNIKDVMERNKIEVLCGRNEKFKLQSGKGKVTVESVNNLPEKYKRTDIIVEPDKKALYEALSKGEKIEGVKLEPTKFVKRYINKT